MGVEERVKTAEKTNNTQDPELRCGKERQGRSNQAEHR
jgi:hypothetical protein